MDASGGTGSNSPIWPIVDNNSVVDMNGTMDNLEERRENLEMVFAYLKNKKMLERQENELNSVTPSSDGTADEDIAELEVASKSKSSTSKPKKGLAAAHTWACTGNKTFGTRKPKDSIVADQARKGKNKVYNQSTNLFKRLPQPNYYLRDDSCFFSSGVFRLAFGPRKSSHYKVVQAGGEAEMILALQRWSIQTGVWSICLGEEEEDAFVVINLSEKVVKYNLISKTNTEIFDIGSNQMDYGDDDADDAVVFIPPFEVDPNLFEFISSLASVYEVVLEKYFEIFISKKDKYKSLELKVKRESSNEETSTSGSEDEEYAIAIRDFKKFFKRRESRGAQEGRVMAHESNEVHSDSLYYSSSSLDDETLQNRYDKLCKLSFKIINKNKLLKTKKESLDNEVFELKEKIKKLEKDKEIDIGCKSCHELRLKNGKLKQTQDTFVKQASKFTKFENNAHCLNEMLSNQKSFKDKKGLGFSECKDSTSKTKQVKFSQSVTTVVSDGTDPANPPERDPASATQGIRPPETARTSFDPATSSRTDFVIITKKKSPNTTVRNINQANVL
ncbi:hypothetical protein Tco_1352135 [Tanacetum coccineum]